MVHISQSLGGSFNFYGYFISLSTTFKDLILQRITELWGRKKKTYEITDLSSLEVTISKVLGKT